MNKWIIYIFCLLILYGCEQPPSSKHNFKEGDCVVIKLTNEQGMATMTGTLYVYVRLRHGKRLLGEGIFHSGTVIDAPYPEIRFWHYELQHCEYNEIE